MPLLRNKGDNYEHEARNTRSYPKAEARKTLPCHTQAHDKSAADHNYGGCVLVGNA